MAGDADHDLTLVRPDRTRIHLGPPPLRPGIRDRFGLDPHTGETGHSNAGEQSGEAAWRQMIQHPIACLR